MEENAENLFSAVRSAQVSHAYYSDNCDKAFAENDLLWNIWMPISFNSLRYHN